MISKPIGPVMPERSQKRFTVQSSYVWIREVKNANNEQFLTINKRSITELY